MVKSKDGQPKILLLWDKYDVIITYVFFVTFICWQVGSIIFTDFFSTLPIQTPFILLALGLISFFKSISEGLSKLNSNVNSVSITEGIQKIIRSSNAHNTFSLFANDGIRYYIVISEEQIHIGTLKVIIYNDIHLEKFKILLSRGIVDRLVVVKMETAPLFHLCFGERGNCLFGCFETNSGKLTSPINLCIDNSTRDTNEFVNCCRRIFNSALSANSILFDSNNQEKQVYHKQELKIKEQETAVNVVAEISKSETERIQYENELISAFDTRSNIELTNREGQKERDLEIAKNLLDFGDSIDKISKITGLSLEEIKKLR
ncbi:MAG: hypothetical protein LBR56_09210 [Sporomusaceae bacterium]|jgi:hypothetical protein|nr:hypothetical protein [Sporomusaceae bacterium]